MNKNINNEVSLLNVMLNLIQHNKNERPFGPESSSRRRIGFTLAEVLITLGIIGVVASLTIPTLINNKAKQETATKLEKVYSTLSQTTNIAKLDYGEVNTWFSDDVTDGTGAGAKIFADRYLIPYLRVAKNCGLSVTSECSERVYYLTSAQGYSDYIFGATTDKFYFNDGTLIGINNYDSASKRFCVYVDINGQAQPNILGKDVFLFFYYSTGKFIPEGLIDRTSALTNANYGCNKNGGRGTYCTGLIMMDGWRIADDYPW